ncbi:hypothetical protein ACP70R_005497 [Stipagrostis hirtigluma subsp. patula]
MTPAEACGLVSDRVAVGWRSHRKPPASRDEIAPRRAKQPIRILYDPSTPCSSAARIHSQGAKRKRHLLRACSTAQPSFPSWGAKRARSASTAPPLLSLSDASIRLPKPCWRDWANLPDGPAGIIAERVITNDVADYVRFRAVCRPWRQCSTDPCRLTSPDKRFHPRRWFMPRERLSPAAPHRRRFLNVSTGQWVQMDLPELQGHCVFGPTAEGLLVLINNLTLVVRLLNPFTRHLTELPSVATLLPRNRFKKCLFSRKGIKSSYAHDLANGDLSVYGAGFADEHTFALYFRNARMLAVARPGEERWTVVDRGTLFMSVLSFAGRFYCADDHGDIMVVETMENKLPQLALAAELAVRFSPMAHTMHLVEINRELMLVHRTLCHDDDGAGCGGYNRKYDVYRVDLEARKTVLVCGLNGHAVFFGQHRALSVSSEAFPSVLADAVYPSVEFDEKFQWEKIDAYRLVDGSIESLVCSYDIQGAMKMARPYRIADYLCLCVRGYCNNSG